MTMGSQGTLDDLIYRYWARFNADVDNFVTWCTEEIRREKKAMVAMEVSARSSS